MSGVRLDVRCGECGKVLETEEYFASGEMISVSGLLEDHACPLEFGA